MNEESVSKILVSEKIWFVFAVRVVLTNQVWVGFGCTQVKIIHVESKSGATHWPKCNLRTHWLPFDADLAFYQSQRVAL